MAPAGLRHLFCICSWGLAGPGCGFGVRDSSGLGPGETAFVLQGDFLRARLGPALALCFSMLCRIQRSDNALVQVLNFHYSFIT